MKKHIAWLFAGSLWMMSVGAEARIGVEASGGLSWSTGSFLNYRGTEFRNGNGFDARVSLILGNWFLGYDFTSMTNGKICGAGCLGSDAFGSTKIHSFTANYRFYLFRKVVQPYLGVGFGGLFGTLGEWSKSNVFGGDFRAAFGLEIPVAKKFFVSIEGRYRYLLTNNPLQNAQQDLVYSLFLGGSVTDSVANTIQDAHTIQVIAGVGAHF
jgi:hypothetical protein